MRRPNTFSHFGIVVPDVEKAESRIGDAGGRIVNRVGKEVDISDDALANAYGLRVEAIGELDEGELEAVVEAFNGDRKTGAIQSAFAEDPDGNLVEVQPMCVE
ncbi:hypothetical protein DPSP01_000008 [Paraphaeosphaeria sporulosa]|uniref:VOC domain-containing protein n=1 Tax=Paraphaeosphaeria sporulosa TaxID=1460663 RepID=A0A177D0V0_9PLEO|nr:uncharacterized protein CC84DRAFT_1212530 [Paraphaeosphaeria sporulosa]OAG13071.1 hypothetical protein CC84DRAFT_1212530 [Paraphaeosphaeria sporulosa]